MTGVQTCALPICLGDLATDGLLALGLFDDTDSNGLSHVSDGEATERGVGGEDLDDELSFYAFAVSGADASAIASGSGSVAIPAADFVHAGSSASLLRLWQLRGGVHLHALDRVHGVLRED